MEQPVGISFLGGLLIVIAAGCICGLLAKLIFRTGSVRMCFDMALGVAGAFSVIFILPMQGYTLGNVIIWRAALLLGAGIPIGLLHLIWKS